MLAFSGSDYPPRSPLEPPGVASQDTHAAVGWQTTLISAASPEPNQLTLINNMISLANSNRVGLVVKGRQSGTLRGYRYNSTSFSPNNVFQSDRAGETLSPAALQAAAASGSELTYTVVPKGSETRIGLDRDADGYFDRDELDNCSNPANASSIPGAIGADIDDDGDQDDFDVAAFVSVLLGHDANPMHVARSDQNCDGSLNGRDISGMVASFLVP
jgi:hypothetical protein